MVRSASFASSEVGVVGRGVARVPGVSGVPFMGGS
jgi:hypothetical protein